MKILVLGSGGREHALVWKLAQEAEVFVSPGNPGMVQASDRFGVSISDHAAIEELCHQLELDLVVIGPEEPLILGLADRLRGAGYAVLGPGAAAARLEGSKAFAKSRMAKAGVPTARAESFTDFEQATRYIQEQSFQGIQVVVKASGPALGKGVVVCSGEDEAIEAAGAMLRDDQFGSAGGTIVIEERLVGPEFSLLTLCTDDGWVSFPVAQDYKRALEDDRGPNTGGMGSVSPVAWLTTAQIEEAEQRVVAPILHQLAEEGTPFRGVLFSGLLVQNGQPYCLEYNVRLGDPETQSVLRRVGSGLADNLWRAAVGQPLMPFSILEHCAVTVVLASGGYPGAYERGFPISIPAHLPATVELFFSGVERRSESLVTHGGRVLGVSATGHTLAEARSIAYQTVDQIEFEGKMFRRDLAS